MFDENVRGSVFDLVEQFGRQFLCSWSGHIGWRCLVRLDKPQFHYHLMALTWLFGDIGR